VALAALLPCQWSYGEIGKRLAAGGVPGDPVYADPRDPREPPAVRALLDEAASVHVTGSVPWRRRPALYREHALFVTVSADQTREQLACGARVVMIGGEPVTGAVAPTGEVWDAPALRDQIAALRACVPLSEAEVLPVLRDIFAAQATPVRLTALAGLAGLGDRMIAGRRIAVLVRAVDAAASAESSARAATAALGDLADRGVSIRTVSMVTDEPGAPDLPGLPDPAGWLRRA